MQNTSTAYDSAIFSPVRIVRAKAEFYTGSALVSSYTESDRIINIEIQRIGEDGKFFGFGVCQRLNIHLIDVNRELLFSTANTIKISIGVKLTGESIEYKSFPTFQISEIHRDENTNELSITAYDTIYKAAEHTVAELTLDKPYTIKQFCEACGALLSVSISGSEGFTLSYENGANFDGTENIREALDDVAEATQTIYFLDANNNLCFKQLDRDGDAVQVIDKSKYITLDSGDNRRLQTICSATELGDNVSESTTLIGTTQYVRDNAFWELREDVASLIHDGITALGNITINVFDCQWRGTPALEIGDKISITTKDNDTIAAYVLNDTISFDGSLSEKTQWKYDTNSTETESNPTNLGDVLKQTYARVDKQEKQIDIVASRTEQNAKEIAGIQINTDKMSASVINIQGNLDNITESLSDRITEVEKKSELAITDEEVSIKISNALANGVSSVKTETGFTFNDDGLTISKSDSQMSTNINEDGMSIFKNTEEVLTVDNTGVNATNLHATTYLIIGTNSRFEDYGSDRTGCFWIGE